MYAIVSNREFSYIYIYIYGLIIRSDMWHNLNTQFKYATIVDLTLVKISLFLLTRLKCHMYNTFKIMMSYLVPYDVSNMLVMSHIVSWNLVNKKLNYSEIVIDKNLNYNQNLVEKK